MIIPEEIATSPFGHEYQILVMGHMGFRNGYVAVNEESPLYAMDYNELSDILYKNQVYIHGGLTYAGVLDVGAYIIGSAENKWYFVFDCGHYEDGKIAFNEMKRLIESSSLTAESKAHEINKYSTVLKYMYGHHMCKSKEYVHHHCMMLSEFIKGYESETSHL